MRKLNLEIVTGKMNDNDAINEKYKNIERINLLEYLYCNIDKHQIK